MMFDMLGVLNAFLTYDEFIQMYSYCKQRIFADTFLLSIYSVAFWFLGHVITQKTKLLVLKVF